MKILPARPFQRMSVLALLILVATAAVWLSKQSRIQVVKASSTLGQPIPNLTSLENTLFNNGFGVFDNTWTVSEGLGPVYNQSNCATCHASPVIGGGSPGDTRKDLLFGEISDGMYVPLPGGPLLEPRSIHMFLPACPLRGEVVPPNANIEDQRLTSQAFGMGLIDSIPDATIEAEATSQQQNMPFGIAGQANMEPDENGITRPGRFGYKAEAVDLIQASAESMVNEIGITNPIVPTEIMPNGQPIPPQCESPRVTEPNDLLGHDLIDIYHYLLYLAPNPFPQQVNTLGENLFNSIGCSTCHLPSYTTAAKVSVQVKWPEGSDVIYSKALSDQTVMLYSDLLLHNMGGLADGFPFGQATGSQFRTTPLWGLSTRTAYLHDGRTTSLATAIADHDLGTGSEAHQVIQNYNALPPDEQTDILEFIGSL